MRDFRSSRSQNLTATFFPTVSATSRASHCSLKMEKTVYLFWIMHPTTQMGVLSKRELKNFSSIHMPRLSVRVASWKNMSKPVEFILPNGTASPCFQIFKSTVNTSFLQSAGAGYLCSCFYGLFIQRQRHLLGPYVV